MKISGFHRGQPGPENPFGALQLDVPFLHGGHGKTAEADELRSIELRAPYTVLCEYLVAIGAPNPAHAARALLSEFDTLPDLMAGSRWRLRRAVGGRLASTIRATRQLMLATLSEPLNERPVVPNGPELLNFLQAQGGFLLHERLIAIYVDRQLRLLSIQVIADGSFGAVQPDFARIFHFGFSVGAAAFVLVHNHPSGTPRPSRADLATTSRLRDLAKQLDMDLLDHLIVARGKVGRVEYYWREARSPGLAE